MNRALQVVDEFHRVFSQHTSSQPTAHEGTESGSETLRTVVSVMTVLRSELRTESATDLRCHRLALAIEELKELAQGMLDRDLVAVFDALLDVEYIQAGTALAYGMQHIFDEGLERVHSSNMSKVGADGLPVIDEAGKVIKGPRYRPVRLADLLERKDDDRCVKLERLRGAICRFYGVSLDELTGRSRSSTVVKARKVYMYLLRNRFEMSLPEVGRVVERDHTTVLSACQSVREDSVLKAETEVIAGGLG